jgi:malonyl-CoA O-methyltransferase
MIEPQIWALDKHRVRRAFENAAAEYDAVAVLQREVAARMLERLDVIRIEPRVILDAGAGTGQAARALRRRYRRSRVVALDAALAMLRQTRAAAGWLRRPLTVCGDLESLPLADASVDLICSSLTLHWCNDLDRALRELRRVLAPGGLLLLTTLGPDTLKELRASWAAVDAYTHVNGFIDMHDIGDAIMRAGFNDPVMDVEMMRLTYPHVEQLMRELKRLGAHNSTQGRARGLTGKQRLQHLYREYEKYRTEDGVLPASYEVIYGVAWAGDAQSSVRGAREVFIPLEKLRRASR